MCRRRSELRAAGGASRRTVTRRLIRPWTNHRWPLHAIILLRQHSRSQGPIPSGGGQRLPERAPDAVDVVGSTRYQLPTFHASSRRPRVLPRRGRTSPQQLRSRDADLSGTREQVADSPMAWPSASRRPVCSSMVRTPPVYPSPFETFALCARTGSPVIDHLPTGKHRCIHRSMTIPRQTATSPDQGASRLPRAARRAQIIETAAGAFLQAGFDSTSMEDVAEAAGITRLVVYRIFDTKEHLYRAVLSSVADEFVAEFQDTDLAEIRRRGGIVRITLGIARRHPDAFRLLWRQAAHEPAFAAFSHSFRQVVSEYAENLIALDGRVTEPQMRRWCATALAAHLLEGISAWLDVGDPSLDDNYIVLQVCGLFAMIEAWGDPHPPAWITPETPTAP
ncbi:MAG TPA: TetR/AcrR family transcriptional regulator [Mycobacterium sp.]|nr:TetR/AcrR family transcriptional regulator [Mycobacterium sp.]